MVEEDHSNGSYDESINSSLSTDESLEFSNFVSSVKLAINRPPLADFIERPKSSLPTARVSPLKVSLTLFTAVAPEWESDRIDRTGVLHSRGGCLSPWWPKLYDMEHRSDSLELECHVCVYIGLCSSSVRSSNTSAPLCFRPGVMAVGVVHIWSQVLLTLSTVKQWRQTYNPTASVSSRFGYTQDLVGGCN